MSESLVLAGDTGGTKSNLALFRGSPGAPRAVAERTYQNREFGSLTDVVRRFRDRGMAEPDWLTARLDTAADRAAVITQAGIADQAAICTKALDLFLSAYGAAAGNLALTALATGGLYIGGGIAPKLVGAFPDSGFMAAFTDKGRLSGMLRDVPVHIVLEPKTALLGAASRALAAP